jgi:CHAT domain-containing protein/Flp pilus assembly protein TadD
VALVMRKMLKEPLNRGLVLIATAFILLASLVAARSGILSWILPVYNNNSNVRLLALNKPIKQEVSTGEARSYQITLSAGQFLRLSVDQWNIGVGVTFYGPDDHKLTEFVCHQVGPTPISLIPEVSGHYRVEVRSLEKESTTGRYEIKLEEVRPATIHDRNRVAAEKAFSEGERLRWEWKSEFRQNAIKKYEEALAHWKAIGEKREVIVTHRIIGEVYYQLGELQRAHEYYKLALLLSLEAKDHRGEGEALNDIAYAYAFHGETQKAHEYSTKALKLSQALNDRRMEAQALHNLGVTYQFWANKQKSLDFYHQALQLWQHIGDRRGQARTLMLIGYAYSELSEMQKASDSFNQALSFWRILNDRREEGLVLTAIGKLYVKLDKKQEALNLFNQAKDLFQPVGDQMGQGMILNGLGYLYNELGDRQKALEYYNQALRLYQAASIRIGEGGQLLKIGEVYFSLGDNRKAVDYYQQALPIIRSLGDRRFESYALSDIGMVHEHLGNTTKALSYYKKALKLNRATKDPRQEAYTLNYIGQVYGKLGKRKKALGYYNQALPLNQITGDGLGESLTLYNIAHEERDRGDLVAARSRIEDSFRIIESQRTKVASQELRTSYFASIHQRSEFYTDLLMRLHKQRPSESLNVAALEASERARARSMLELLTEARANIRQGINPELLERERSLQQSLNDKAERQARLLGGKHTEEDVAAIAKEIQELTTKYDQIKAQIRVESPHYAALTQPQPSSLKEIQQLLDDDTILLEFALGSERSYLWAVTRTGLKSFELPSRDQIEKAARPVYDLLSSSQLALSQPEKQREMEYWRKASALSRMLLNPVAEQLGNKRLLIVADGVLQYIPFAALPIPESRGQGEKETRRQEEKEGTQSAIRNPQSAIPYVPLINEHEIVNLPSASTLAVLRREMAGRRPAPKAVAVLANPVFEADDMRVLASTSKTKGAPTNQVAATLPSLLPRIRGLTRDGSGFPRLPETENEARAIEEVTTPSERLIAKSFDANRAKAIGHELSQYRIIHFATHGILDGDNPELSAIVLSLVDQQGNPLDGFLRLHDIYNLDLPAELVVLSACNTGLGKEIKGEGLIGLTRGFMYAGAARVMASLWKVEDEATAKLMKHFYRNMLKDGLPPAAALRKAQVALWQDKRWRAPYYWAAFVLQGEWR